MAKETLILIHGMGNHTTESIKKTVAESLNKAVSRYDPNANFKIEDNIDIVPIVFNDVFEKHRKAMSQESGDIAKRFEAISDIGNIGNELARRLAGYETEFGQDTFFNTHWLDVIFYRSLLGEHIRIKVAKALTKEIRDRTGATIHILAHSLGTAVLHDTLAKLFKNQFDPRHRITPLLTQQHRVSSVWMVSNVSRALESFVKVEDSIVKPGPEGCCNYFIESRHTFDPFTRIRPFNPGPGDNWVPADAWNNYHLLHPTAISALNTHDLAHYLADPLLHQPLLRMLINFRPKKAERDAAEKSFNEDTLSGTAQQLKQRLEAIQFDSQDTLASLMRVGASLKEIIEEFGEVFT